MSAPRLPSLLQAAIEDIRREDLSIFSLRGSFPTGLPPIGYGAWALLGGIPYYLEQWDPQRSLEWNVTNRLLRKGAVLYDEAELMIKEELGTDAATYLSIIAAVAGGDPSVRDRRPGRAGVKGGEQVPQPAWSPAHDRAPAPDERL